jgi:hypothetical protein
LYVIQSPTVINCVTYLIRGILTAAKQYLVAVLQVLLHVREQNAHPVTLDQ